MPSRNATGLKPGGKLWLQAPDYDSWYEPHYMLPFFPKMNKTIAKFYLRLLGRPVSGLSTLQWITTEKVCSILSQGDFYPTNILDISKSRRMKKFNDFRGKHGLPNFLSFIIIKFLDCKVMFKREARMNLLITKN